MKGPSLVPILPCPGGMDNWHEEYHDVFQNQKAQSGGLLPPKKVISLIDMDLDNNGFISSRLGTSLIRELDDPQGLWTLSNRLFYQDGAVLYEHLTDDTEVVLVSGLARRVTLVEHAGSLYGSDGAKNFVIKGLVASTWGLAVPTVTVSSTTGALPAGKYLVQASWSDALENEGGVSDLKTILLASPQAIVVNAVPPSNATHLNVYASEADQEHTSFVAKVPIASLPYTIAAAVSEADPPVTEHMTGPWAGLIGLLSFRSFLLLWRDGVIVHSEAHEPHLFHADSIWQFPGTVQAVEALSDGVWVATTAGLWWVSGEDPSTMIPIQADPAPCFKGSICILGQRVPAIQEDDNVAFFVCSKGLIAARPGGKMTLLTAGSYDFGSLTRVSMCCSEREKLRQLHVALVP